MLLSHALAPGGVFIQPADPSLTALEGLLVPLALVAVLWSQWLLRKVCGQEVPR